MIPKAIGEITEADISNLITNKVAEGKTIEYKGVPPGGSDSEKVKFLRIVTSFANTVGGDLLYGVQATNGIPTAAPGLPGVNEDQEKLRLESLCLSGAQPRLTGVQYCFVPILGGGPVLVVRVARTWNMPHRVTLGGHSHFYGRNAAGSYQLDVEELRNLFTLSESQADRIRAFRVDRLAKIIANEGPVPVKHSAELVMHIVPVSAFSAGQVVDVVGQRVALRTIGVIGKTGHSTGINLDGFYTHAKSSEGPDYAGYTLFFRSGAVEAVGVIGATSDIAGDRIIPSQAYERWAGEFLPEVLARLEHIGIVPPAFLFLSLIGVKGYRYGVHPSLYSGGPNKADRDNLILPEVLLQDFKADPFRTLKPLFDMVWNAFGFEGSANYDDQGNWSPQR